MDISQVKFDCKHFKGYIPCKPNKLENAECSTCKHYKPWDKKILIIKLGAMGDVIRTTPLVVRYREMYGDVHFTWLTLFPDVLPKESVQEIYTPEAFELLKIKGRHYDIAINLDKDEEACMLLDQVDAKEKYGFSWKNRHLSAATPAANHKIMTGLFDHISIKNTKSYLEEIFEICHLDFQKEEYLLNYNKKIAEDWKDKFAEKADGRKIVGLNTGCGNRWQTRLWPDEYWETFINSLDQTQVLPILLGGPQENEKNTWLAEKTGAWYPGTFPLKTFISLTANLDAVVTQVSMMMHIAVGHKTPMVLMNNIFNKHEFEMYGRGVIVEPETGCDCYFGNSCSRERSCMYDMKPETIKNELMKLIQ
ncbi:MAG: glycosyltransferase family 9 protein [Bacteroidales bacterium]|jgi:ADP-heptose:LPS heptosyltransferase|nr:glycosyltransferase family 9 protein [Bacteroidales bacterium]